MVSTGAKEFGDKRAQRATRALAVTRHGLDEGAQETRSIDDNKLATEQVLTVNEVTTVL